MGLDRFGMVFRMAVRTPFSGSGLHAMQLVMV